LVYASFCFCVEFAEAFLESSGGSKFIFLQFASAPRGIRRSLVFSLFLRLCRLVLWLSLLLCLLGCLWFRLVPLRDCLLLPVVFGLRWLVERAEAWIHLNGIWLAGYFNVFVDSGAFRNRPSALRPLKDKTTTTENPTTTFRMKGLILKNNIPEYGVL